MKSYHGLQLQIFRICLLTRPRNALESALFVHYAILKKGGYGDGGKDLEDGAGQPRGQRASV